MSHTYLIQSPDQEHADLGLCEYDETFVSIEQAALHIAEGHIVTWLREETA